MARRVARGDSRIDGALLAISLLLSVVARALPEPRADRVAGVLRHTVLYPLMSLQERAERASHALSQQDSTVLAADSALMRGLDAGRLAGENDRLRQLLGLGARVKNGFVAAEALHGSELGEEYTVVLNAGTRAGVLPFSAVIAPEGIVGYVRSAGEASSVAIVWPHPDFRVSAIARSEAPARTSQTAVGIVSAHLGSGASRFLLELRGVPFRSPLGQGTLVMSSGVGGTFPRGIPIGTVLRELPSAEGWERNYLLQPAVHAADVGTVLILQPGKTQPDQTSVWATDSSGGAQRRVATAGDSIARITRDSIMRATRDSISRAVRDSIARGARDTVKKPAPRDTLRWPSP